MGRKNSNANRRNIKGRLDRREQGMPKLAPRQKHKRTPLEHLVIPEGKCFFRSRKGKAIYRTQQKAAAALADAQRTREWSGSNRVEKRYYKCPAGQVDDFGRESCGGFHLTSREEYQERGK